MFSPLPGPGTILAGRLSRATTSRPPPASLQATCTGVPAGTCRVLADDLGRDTRDHAPVGYLAAHHRPGGHHHVPADTRARQDNRARAEPGPPADGDRGVARPLPPDRDVRVGVTVILVG